MLDIGLVIRTTAMKGSLTSKSLCFLCGVLCLPKVPSRTGHRLLFEKQEKFQKSGAIQPSIHPSSIYRPTYPPTCISCILVICLHIVCKGVILELKSQKIVMIYRIYRVKYTVLLRCCYYHSRRIPSELDVATLAGLLLLSYAAGKTANFLCKINMFCGCVVCFTW